MEITSAMELVQEVQSVSSLSMKKRIDEQSVISEQYLVASSVEILVKYFLSSRWAILTVYTENEIKNKQWEQAN